MARGWLFPWAMGSVAFGGASLLVPLYVVELGGGPLELGILASVAAFVGVPGAILFGRWADQHGRRRPYVIGSLILTTAMLAVIPFTESVPVVLFANGLIWFSFAAAMPVLTLLAVDGEPAHSWSTRIALLNKYQGWGWAIGLLFGSVWTAILGVTLGALEAIQTFFIAMAILGGIGVVIGVRTFPVDGVEIKPVSGIQLRRAIVRASPFNVRTVTFPFTVARFDITQVNPRRFIQRFTPTLGLYFLAIILVFSGFSAFFAPLPAFLTDIGFTSGEIFGLYLASSIASAVCFGLVGKLASKGNVAVFQAAGLLVRGLAFPAVALVGVSLGTGFVGLGTLAGVFVIVGITWAVITVTAGTLVTALTPIAIRGEALGVYAAMTALAGGFGAIIGGYLGAISFLLGFTVAGGLILIGAGIVYSLRRVSGSISTDALESEKL